ncbi:ATP-binding protein [Streptomyces sp. NBC_01716]|uniref:ATP-binding protein n=1 Tax=Streptomyces sp. NBC_01716 TaxID=2975917 RepID=UPI002E34C97E|nr:ATP-binding protein [Streptomyces sp. NBC_01716]
MTAEEGPPARHPAADTDPSPAPGPPLVVKRWLNSARSVGKARRLLLQHLKAWGQLKIAVSAELVLSELLTNSLRHGHVPGRLIETRYQLLSNGVRIEVHDAHEARPQRREPSAEADCEGGLARVDALTGGRWGVSDRVGIGKLVWAFCVDDGSAEMRSQQ